MSRLYKLEKMSIERLRMYEPPEGYYLAFSGGKDSVAIKALADAAGVKYDAVYRHTSVDPPELVRFIRELKDVRTEYPRYKDGRQITMWNLMTKKCMPPTRRIRYCCQHFKEDSGDGKIAVTGVRWAESDGRKANQGIATIIDASKRGIQAEDGFQSTPKGGLVLRTDNAESRRMVEQCYRDGRVTVNPIVDWEDNDVWEFIRSNTIKVCGLYDEGFKRLGCIGCPMAGKGRIKEFARWPKYKDMYLRSFGKIVAQWEQAGRSSKKGIKTGEDLWHWWMEDGVLPGQISMDLEV